LVRRAIAAGVGLLVLILLVLGVRGCLNARKEQAIKDYNRDTGALLQESDQESRVLFGLLGGATGGRDRAVDIENQLNTLRVNSQKLVERAKDTDHPDEVDKSQRYLLETLEFRRDGLAAIADALPQALGDQERRQGTDKVTANMQDFLTSDVVYSQRFVPNMEGVLKDEDLADEVRIPRSQFLPDIQWLQPSFVAGKVSRLRSGGGGGGPAAPGLHGNGLGSVTLGGQTLTPGGSASITLAKDLAFDVQVVNQGENTETDVEVRVTVGKGGDAIDLSGNLDSIAAGETKTVKIALDEQPPTGQNVPITVEVAAVPGEKKTDNNKQTYSAIFTK
jgi:hypothetical protein